MILLHDNAPSHTTKPLKKTIEAFSLQIYFLMRLTHQTWLYPITTYLHRCDSHLLRSASLLSKMYENGSMIGLPQKSNIFLARDPQIARKMGKMCS